MRNGKHIARLTPAVCEEIQSSMLNACQAIAVDHGLLIESAGWRSADAGFSFEPVFRVSIPAADGTAFNLDKDMFTVLAEQYGLAPSDFGREFVTGSERFRITGIDPKRPKYPVSAERLPDRRSFKIQGRERRLAPPSPEKTMTFSDCSAVWPKSQLRAD